MSYLPMLPFIFLGCWTRNFIAQCISECMIQLALSLTICPCIASTPELLLMVILTLSLSTVKGDPPCLALETVNIHNVRSKILAQHTRTLHCYTMCSITSCTHFDYIFVIMRVNQEAIMPYILTQWTRWL